jgi:hypothetical protein
VDRVRRSIRLLSGNGAPRKTRGNVQAKLRQNQSELNHLSPDGYLLFGTRLVRMFAYGFLSVVLVLYLAKLGFNKGLIGIILSLALIGDAAISLWMTTNADR